MPSDLFKDNRTVDFFADRPSVETLCEVIRSHGPIVQIEMIEHYDPNFDGPIQVFGVCNRLMTKREIIKFLRWGLKAAQETLTEARLENPQADWFRLVVVENPVDDRGYSSIVGFHMPEGNDPSLSGRSQNLDH
jgi:hypothetical protein